MAAPNPSYVARMENGQPSKYYPLPVTLARRQVAQLDVQIARLELERDRWQMAAWFHRHQFP